MPKKTDTLELWNQVCKTDPKQLKEYQGSGGFKGTAICAQYQLKIATSMFGSFGIGWGVCNPNYEYVQLGEDITDTILVYSAVLYYHYNDNRGEFEIDSEIALYFKSGKQQNDCRKKVRTDAITKGLSQIGVSSDVFENKFSDNKYVAEMTELFKEKPKPEKKISKKNLNTLIDYATKGYGEDKIEAKIAEWLIHFAVDKMEDISDTVGGKILSGLKEKFDK